MIFNLIALDSESEDSSTQQHAPMPVAPPKHGLEDSDVAMDIASSPRKRKKLPSNPKPLVSAPAPTPVSLSHLENSSGGLGNPDPDHPAPIEHGSGGSRNLVVAPSPASRPSKGIADLSNPKESKSSKI